MTVPSDDDDDENNSAAASSTDSEEVVSPASSPAEDSEEEEHPSPKKQCLAALSSQPSQAHADIWGDRYFERQEEAHCGKHALNNLIGGPQFQIENLLAAALEVVDRTGSTASEHIRDNGWYSHSVLARVLRNVEPHPLRMRLAPLACTSYENVLNQENVVGAVVNQDNVHWSAIVKHQASLWHVDSTSWPQLLHEAGYTALLLRYPMTFAIAR